MSDADELGEDSTFGGRPIAGLSSANGRADYDPDFASPAEKSAGWERVLLALLAIVQLTNIMDFMIVMPLGHQIMREFSISPRLFSLIVSSYTLSAGISGILAALWLDRFDRKTALLGLYAGFTLGTFLCGFATSYYSLLAARVLTGAFGGVLGALCYAIVGDVFPESRRGMATGVLMSGFAMASVAGVPFGLFLGNRFGWNAPFYLLGGLGLPVWVTALFVMPALRGHLARARRESGGRELLIILTESNHLRAFALMASLMIGSFIVVPFLAPALIANSGVAEGDLFWIYVCGGACAFFSSPVVGRLADRFGKLTVYRLSALISIIPMVALTNLGRVPLVLALFTTTGMMVANSARMVPAMAMVTSSVVPWRRGGFMSVNAAVQHFSAGIGSFVGGMIVGRGHDGSLIRFDLAGIVGVVAVALSLYLAGRLRVADAAVADQKSAPVGDVELVEWA
jgi:predicted MFS family arabinose efflux permease